MARKATKKARKTGSARDKTSASSKGTKKVAKKSKARRKTADMINDVRDLVALMTANDITEVQMQDGEMKIVLRRGQVIEPSAAVVAGGVAQTEVAKTPGPSRFEPVAAAEKEELIDIKSPMVGTFYAAESPDSDPYVTMGANINNDAVVCIVEAMKVMNEIKAECSGTIAEICVKNGQPVEFGQPLFRVRPA